MPGLPASIEGYLRDTGFTATELLVLRHLMSGGSMTLRQLAAKTGKSTGVLDQATKKLLEKGILAKDIVNDGSRFAIISLEAIQAWIHDEHREQIQRFRRRAEDLGAFLETVAFERRRPHFEYFEGDTAFGDMMDRLLEEAETEILHLLPLECKEEDDPYFGKRSEWNRKRSRLDLPLRVIVPNTMLGRRFRDRDALTQRKTSLLPGDRSQIGLEQFITGEWLACCDHRGKRHCFMKFPEFAESQRLLFESFWSEVPKVIVFRSEAVQSQTVPLPA